MSIDEGKYIQVPFTKTSTGILVDISSVSIASFPSSNYVTFNTFILRIEYAADQCPPSWVQSTVNNRECLTSKPNTTDWSSANQECELLGPGGALTSVTSAFENREIASKKC